MLDNSRSACYAREEARLRPSGACPTLRSMNTYTNVFPLTQDEALSTVGMRPAHAHGYVRILRILAQRFRLIGVSAGPCAAGLYVSITMESIALGNRRRPLYVVTDGGLIGPATFDSIGR